MVISKAPLYTEDESVPHSPTYLLNSMAVFMQLPVATMGNVLLRTDAFQSVRHSKDAAAGTLLHTPNGNCTCTTLIYNSGCEYSFGQFHNFFWCPFRYSTVHNFFLVHQKSCQIKFLGN